MPATPLPDDMPYSAAANSAAALGVGTNGAGDPIGSAQLFPLLTDGSAAGSWGYRLVGGADIGAAAGPSVEPLHLSSVNDGSVSVSGERQYSYSGAQPSFSGSVQVSEIGRAHV